jgi:hypothetical protein
MAKGSKAKTEQASEEVVSAEASAAAAVAAAAVGLVSTTSPPGVEDRDVMLGEGSAGHKMNLLLQDIIRLHHIVWKLQDKPLPTKVTDKNFSAIVDHVFDLVKNGKSYGLAGLKDVPKPFMTSTGSFFGKGDAEETWKKLSDKEAKKTLAQVMFDEFATDDLGDLSPYEDLKKMLFRKVDPEEIVMPEAKDVVLLNCSDMGGEKMYEQQLGNRTMFTLASQIVTTFSNTSERRVEAALSIMKGLDEAEPGQEVATEKTSTSKFARFLIRSLRSDDSVAWDVQEPLNAVEFTVMFVFEVFLEKEIHIVTDQTGLLEGLQASEGDTTIPVAEPTDSDVLFGRGGMTNRCVALHL